MDHKIDWILETLPIRKDLSYEKKPIGIMTRDVRRLRRREIPLVKVLWKIIETTRPPGNVRMT